MATANRTFRSSMLLSTAVAALVAMPGVAHAQLVTSGDLVDAIDSGGNPGQLTVTDVNATRTDMRVLAPVVVANWNRFNVPTGTTVNVENGSAATQATLVNRVIGANFSDISGTINAADVNFWLINQNGILFGDGAQVNTRSFFASTLDVTDADLFDFYEGTDLAGNGSSTIRFSAPAASTTAISGGGLNTNFVTDGTMMFVGPALNLDATFNAGTGTVAFVAATDVSVSFTPGSPLTYTLNAGTTVAEQTIAGSVSGGAIDIQMLTASGVVGALLNVDASLNATTALPTSTGIRLSASQAGSASVTVEMTGGISSTGRINLFSDGALSSTEAMSGSGVSIIAGETTLDDVTATNGTVALIASGNLVAGDVSATGGIQFSASNTGSATFGSLVSTGGLVGNSGLVPGSITVTGLTQGGSVNFLTGGLNLGDVVATSGPVNLRSGVGFIAATDVTVGNVTAATGVNITGLSITAGDIVAQNGLAQLTATNGITTASITSVLGAIDVDSTAGGDLDLGALEAAGNIDLDTTGSITTAAITAGGNLTVGAVRVPGSVTFTGDASASSITIDTTGAFSGLGLTATGGNIDIAALSIAAGDIAADAGDVQLFANNDITTGAITGRAVGATSGGDIILGDVTATDGEINLSAGADLVAGNLLASSNLFFAAGNANSATLASAVSTGGIVAINGAIPGSLTITGLTQGRSVSLFTNGGDMTLGNVVSTVGSVFLEAPVGVMTTGTIDAATELVMFGGSINAGDLTARSGLARLQAAGNITTSSVTALAGAIDIDSNAGGDLDLGELEASGNIDLDTTGSITAAAITAGGNLTVGATALPSSVTFTDAVSAGSISIDSAGAFSGLALTAETGDIIIDAGTINTGALLARAGDVGLTAAGNITTASVFADRFTPGNGTITITSTGGGALSHGLLSAGSDITLDTTGSINGSAVTSAGGAITIGGTLVPGAVTFTGNFTADSVTVDALAAFQAGNITARTGDIDIAAQSITVGNLRAEVADVLLVASGDITTGALTADRLNTAGGTVIVSSTGGGALNLGGISAGSDITLNTTGNISGTSATSTAGALTIGNTATPGTVTFTGNLLAQSVTVDALGAFSAANITARTGDIDVDALSIDADTLRAEVGNVLLVADNGITTGAVTADRTNSAGGTITIRSTAGGALNLGALTAGANIALDTAGSITGTSANSVAGDVVVGANAIPGDVTFSGSLTGQNVIVNAFGAFSAADLTARAGSVEIDALSIEAGTVRATGGDVSLVAQQGITAGPITATEVGLVGGLVTVDSTNGGTILLDSVTADQNILIDSTGNITTGNLTSKRGVFVGANRQPALGTTTTLGNVRGERVYVETLGALATGTVTATNGAIDLTADSMTTLALSATGGNVTLRANGDITTASITARTSNGNGGGIDVASLAGGDLDTGALVADQSILLNTTGSVQTAAVTAGGAFNVGQTAVPGSVTLGGNVSAASVFIRSTGEVLAGERDAQGNLLRRTSITATQGGLSIDAGTITTGDLRATGGDVTLTSAGGIDTTAITAINANGNGGNAILSALRNIRTGSIDATGFISVVSTGTGAEGGSLSLGALTAGTDITLDADLGITTGAILSTGGILRAGLASDADSVRFNGTATARSILVETAGAFTGDNIAATAGVVDIDAGTISAADISSTGGSTALTAQGQIGTGNITSTGGILVESLGTGMAAGNITLGRLTATDNIFIDGNGTITSGLINAGGNLLVGLFSDATAVTFTANATARSIEIDTLGALQAAGLTSTSGSVNVNADTIRAAAVTANVGGVVMTARGNVDTGAISATTAVSIVSTGTGTNAGNLTLASVSAGEDIVLNANGTIGTGALTSTGGAVLIGLTSAPTAVTLSDTVTARRMIINSAGTIATQRLEATAGDVTLTAVRGINATAITATGTIGVTSTGTGTSAGNVTLGTLSAGGNITLNGNAGITTGNVTSTGGALSVGLTSAATSVTFGGDVSARSIAVRSTGAVVAERRDAQGNLLRRTNLTATAGDVTVNGASITTGLVDATRGGVNLTASGNITTSAMTATRVAGVGGAIRVLSTGTGANAGVLNLGALLADLGIELDAGGAIATGAMTARNGAVDVEGARIDITGATAATGGNVRLLAAGAINTGALSSTRANNAGGSIDIDSTNSGAITTGALSTVGTPGGITLDTLGTVTVNGTIDAGATGARTNLVIGADRLPSAVTLNGKVQAANVTANSSGRVTANAIDVGNGTVTVESADVELLGLVEAGTGTVTLKSRGNGTIGLGTAVGTMRLTDTELDLINARTLVINAGSGNIGIAGVSFDADAGSTAVNIATTGTIAITGDLTGTGAGRTFRLGGAVSDPANTTPSTAARITANIDLATINLGTATLDLRGNNIVFGQQSLIDKVATMTLDQQVKELIGNAGSLLYTPENLSAARLANPTYLTAANMKVTYGGSALFQNSVPRTGGDAFGGVSLGGSAGSATAPLELNPLVTPNVVRFEVQQGNVFAIFGSINGTTGPAAALGGDSVIKVNNKVLIPASRVNGCIIGSAEGCITTIVGNFILSVPREVVSPIVAEEGTPQPFDPLVGTNNESLFSDAASASENDEACRERDAAGVCVRN